MVRHAERVPNSADRFGAVRFGRLAFLGLVLSTLAGLLLPSSRGQEPAPQTPPGNGNPLDEPLDWLNQAKRNYATVRDYACTLVTRENVGGVLQDENVIQFKMRTQPFSVSMRWVLPAKLNNQEVCFVLGQNNNRMRVKAAGVTRVAGFVSLDPNDYRVAQRSRHNIYEAGIGSLIEQTLSHWDTERKLNQTQVNVAEYNFQKPCLRIETIRPQRRPEFYCYRSVLYIDKATKLPVRNENYDWPRPGGEADGELVEMFSYVDLQLNVGLPDRDFIR